MENFNKNAAYIYSVITHIGTMGSHKFHPKPHQMMFGRYDYHAASYNYYMFQIYDWPFHQALYFLHCAFGP